MSGQLPGGISRATSDTSPATMRARLEAKTFHEPMSGCWLWAGAACGSKGGVYGQIRRGNKVLKAHRLAYELAHGSIPDGMTIDHVCGVMLCVNPQHLRVATQRENILAGGNACAENARKERCIRGHQNWGARVRDGHRTRFCRSCERRAA